MKKSHYLLSCLRSFCIEVFKHPVFVIHTHLYFTYLKAETVHLQGHFKGEEHNKEEIGDLLKVIKPCGLAVMFSSQYARVEEHEDDNEPEHALRLDGPAAVSTSPTIELVKAFLLLLKPSVGLRVHAFLSSFAFRIRLQLGYNRD